MFVGPKKKLKFAAGDGHGHPHSPIHPYGRVETKNMDESGPIWDGPEGYPHRSREVGGDCVFTPFSPVYSVYRAFVGKNPWVGHVYRFEGDNGCGGVTNAKINPDYT